MPPHVQNRSEVVERRTKRYWVGGHVGCPWYRTAGTGRGRSWFCAVTGERIEQAYAECSVRPDDERLELVVSTGDSGE